MSASRKSWGQTLVEALVTILFVAIGVIALVRFQNYLAYDNSLAQQRADATLIATKEIENLRDFQTYNAVTGYNSYLGIISGSSVVTGTNTQYNVTRTVQPRTKPTYKTILVFVSWQDRNGTTQSVELDTNIAGIDPGNSASVK